METLMPELMPDPFESLLPPDDGHGARPAFDEATVLVGSPAAAWPATPLVPSAPSRPAAVPLRFHVSGRDDAAGDLRLTVHAQHIVPHAVEAAIVLDRCDTWLAAIDGWLGTELDWTWSGTDATDPPPLGPVGPVSSVGWVGSVGAGWSVDPPVFETFPSSGSGAPPAEAEALRVRLELPWSLLRAAGPPPAALVELLQWDSVPAVLSMAHLSLDADELACLEPGGAVVLADSMRDTSVTAWRAELRAEATRPGAGAAWRLDTTEPGRLMATPDPEPQAIGNPPHASASLPHASGGRPLNSDCEIRAVYAFGLSATLVAGWSASPLSLSDITQTVELWRLPHDGRPERRLAAGRLIPWASGWAMLIEAN